MVKNSLCISVRASLRKTSLHSGNEQFRKIGTMVNMRYVSYFNLNQDLCLNLTKKCWRLSLTRWVKSKSKVKVKANTKATLREYSVHLSVLCLSAFDTKIPLCSQCASLFEKVELGGSRHCTLIPTCNPAGICSGSWLTMASAKRLEWRLEEWRQTNCV